MPPRTIYLITSRPNPTHRSHFAIFIPTPHHQTGTLIHATGAPKAGYTLEFKRNHCPAADTQEKYTVFPIGEIDSDKIVDSPAGDSAKRSDCVPRGAVEDAAARVAMPGISENFLAPVTDVGVFVPVAILG
ncbi:hypothetical protein N7466_003134 [Penicillium verhagenii]|uniref:uncharacterized protein n=1 Tax=Penicillium verhagenii TaxID=1562060 RepID=UPI002544E7D5|nr:uncharacterized protein N7466_003134 [Penicillium verhagenii]KAJ5936684.1 hypothetical protein N7466_003134 [Penicillium verhagenii]